MSINPIPFPQQLATEFFSKFYSIGIKPVQVASTEIQSENSYALEIQFGNNLYKDCKNYNITFNEDTLKDAVILFLIEDSAHGSEYEYPVTADLIESVFALVKAKMHWAIATGHVELLFDPETLKKLLEENIIGRIQNYVTTIYNDDKEDSEDKSE